MIDEDFSKLTTVSVFDKGETSCRGLKTQEDVKNFSPSSLLIESLIAELSHLIEEDPQKQKKLYLSICQALRRMNLVGKGFERDDMQFMRTPYQQALYTLLNLAKATNVENRDLIISSKLSGLPLTQVSSDIIKWSRYMLEFEELSYIAHGGFGSVFKAKHRLDDSVYAVKKISLNACEVKENIMEVRMLAKLNHPNIVAYKAAWIELVEKEKQDLPPIDDSKDSLSSNKSSSDWIVFDDSQKKSSSEEPQTSNSQEPDGAVCQYKGKCWDSPLKYTSATLYIQMQFCEQTLRRWIDSRNREGVIDDGAFKDVFKKMVKGVEYIHSQGIVHHDINPNNIFISEDLKEVQVGDFGLACCILSHQTQSATETHRKGTFLYAAPEQLNGVCNSKSDIYSLGIVLFELIVPFQTSMERVEMLKQLKSGKIPTDFISKYPQWAKLISRTVDELEKRLTASELLKELDETNDDGSKDEIKAQREIIKLLRKESLEKDLEIAQLKRQLEQFKNNSR